MAAGRSRVVRFFGDASMVVVQLARDGVLLALPVERSVADALVTQYGAPTADGVDMTGLVGRSAEHEESETGTVVRLDVLTERATEVA